MGFISAPAEQRQQFNAVLLVFSDPDQLLPEGHEFLNACFAIEPEDRPTCRQLLSHAYMNDKPPRCAEGLTGPKSHLEALGCACSCMSQGIGGTPGGASAMQSVDTRV